MYCYKKLMAAAASAWIIAACTHSGGADVDQATACVDPRPQMCTMEYDPVCGTLDDGTEETYSTGCTACSSTAVTQYRPGEC